MEFRPLYCVWELTLACNLRCSHCGSCAGNPRRDELGPTECLGIIDQLADLGCRLITFSGGEPTLREDLPLLGRAAIHRGIVANIVSNGTTITPTMAARLRDAGFANVAVSIDGPEDLHDEIRGKGNFRRAARGLETLARAGMPTAVLTHLDQRSAARLEETHDIAAGLGARSFRVQLSKPMGNQAGATAGLLRPGDLLELLPRVARLKRRSSMWVDVGDSIGYFGPDERVLRRKAWGQMQPCWSGCQAGRFAIGIESDGGVKGCLSLQARLPGVDGDPFREGGLREERLESIWARAFAWNRGAGELEGFCRTCDHAALCRGGAKCVAAAFTGGLGQDPYCYHRVATLEARRRRVGRVAAVAASLGGLVGLGGCFPERQPDPYDPPDANPACVEPCPDCDYGILPPECFIDAGPADAAPAPDADPCVESCPTCEYGVLPPECFIDAAPVDAVPGPDANCEGVCCDCDYGVIPPGECCP